MKLYRTKYNQFIDENNIEVSHEAYLAYLETNEPIEETDFIFPNSNQSELVFEETQRYLQRIKDGQDSYAKISAEFRLAKLSGQLSEQAHVYIENLLIPVRNEVLAGQWISGLQKLEAIGAVQVGQELYDRLHSQLTDYITENYQV